MLNTRRASLRVVLFWGLLSLNWQAHSAELRIVPTLIDLSWPSQAALMQILNKSDEPITVQFRLFEWQQVDGSNKLSPSNAIVASPPIANIAGGTLQAVRLVRTSKQEPSREMAYRLVIDELPQDADGDGVRVLLRYSIPVFISPKGELQSAQLNWKLLKQQDKIFLQASNRGAKRSRLTGFRLDTTEGELMPFGEGLMGYVLPDQIMQWPLNSKIAKSIGTQASFSVNNEKGLMRGQLQLEDIP